MSTVSVTSDPKLKGPAGWSRVGKYFLETRWQITRDIIVCVSNDSKHFACIWIHIIKILDILVMVSEWTRVLAIIVIFCCKRMIVIAAGLVFILTLQLKLLVNSSNNKRKIYVFISKEKSPLSNLVNVTLDIEKLCMRSKSDQQSGHMKPNVPHSVFQSELLYVGPHHPACSTTDRLVFSIFKSFIFRREYPPPFALLLGSVACNPACSADRERALLYCDATEVRKGFASTSCASHLHKSSKEKPNTYSACVASAHRSDTGSFSPLWHLLSPSSSYHALSHINSELVLRPRNGLWVTARATRSEPDISVFINQSLPLSSLTFSCFGMQKNGSFNEWMCVHSWCQWKHFLLTALPQPQSLQPKGITVALNIRGAFIGTAASVFLLSHSGYFWLWDALLSKSIKIHRFP